MPTRAHAQAWEDWSAVDPLFAATADPRHRGGADPDGYLAAGAAEAKVLLDEVTRLGLGRRCEMALEFGCGAGRHTGPLADRFDRVVAVDVAPAMVAEGRRLHAGRANCAFRLNQADDLAWMPDAFCDLVLAVRVVEYLETPAAARAWLVEFLRVLRPGGALVVRLPVDGTSEAGGQSRPVRARGADGLRRLGVPATVLYRRLDWVPEVSALGFDEEETRHWLEAAGATVVRVAGAPARRSDDEDADAAAATGNGKAAAAPVGEARTWFVTR